MPLRLQTIFIQRVTARTWHRNSHKSLQLFTTLATTSEGCLYKSQKGHGFPLDITLLPTDCILDQNGLFTAVVGGSLWLFIYYVT